MNGTKRFGVFDSNPDSSDTAFRSKRIMAGSSFGSQRVEPSQPQLISTPPLDAQRAESSRQHVRALNTQFASWVQTQLQNHPDELWEDGVQDYLSHASDIKEKFSDVVKWLSANVVKGENSSVAGSLVAQKKLMPEVNNNEIKSLSGFGGFVPVSTAPSFATSWSSGSFNNNKSPFLFGNPSSVPVNRDASDDVDGETELEQPSSPSVKKTEEKGVVVVHEVKCKLYVKSSDPADKDAWKDKGMGHLSIKCKEGLSKGTKDSKPTIVVRNDVGRLLLNALIYPGIKTNLQKNAIVAILHTSADDGGNDGGNNGSVVARTFLIRTKTEEDRDKLATTIQEYAPST